MTLSLTPTQEEVVSHSAGALLVIAGPGAGKTRVLTERIRRLLLEEEGHFRILALTFTNKAANEMVERLDDVEGIRDRAFIGTFHSFCMEVLANRGRSIGIDGLPNIFESFEDRKQILADAVRADPDLSQQLIDVGSPKEQRAALTRWLQAISDAKGNLQTPSMLEDKGLARLYEAYDAELRASSAVDFDDLLLLTYRVFEENPKTARFYRRQYRYVCIDEGQDLNESQYRLLCALCANDHRNVMVVGDPKQAIYVWNGADPKYLELFSRDFDATVIELEDNFRSSRAVVAAARSLNPKYEVQGQLPIRGELTCQPCKDEEEEAGYVIDELERLKQEGHQDIEGDVTPERCCVLGRNRFVFSALEQELRQCGTPYHKKISAGAYHSLSGVVEEFELGLRVVANPHDRLHIGSLAKAWGISEDANQILTHFPSSDRKGSAVLAHMQGCAATGSAKIVMEAIQALSLGQEDRVRMGCALDRLEEMTSGESDEKREEIYRDLSVWREHWDQFNRSQSGGYQSIQVFLSQWALGTTEQANREGLALLTVHSAKGMEFDVVFVIGLCAGTFPDYRARKGPTMEEEDRSAFVAVTRSRRLLYLSYPRIKMMPWGDYKHQEPSRYFTALEQLSVE